MAGIRTKRRKRHLRFEPLECRKVMATWGIPWADPQHLTASFVPDGTALPGGGSQLYRTLDSQLGAGNWEVPILKALQAWASGSNINVGLVPDGGQPVGAAGPAQGDARFGDIRISAEPLPADVVAITSPYSPASGTMSGDIILNSNDDFDPSEPGSFDLYTVALHEAGHVFGFADSADPASFMYDAYTGPQTGLAPAAVPALQALYGGPRAIDALDGTAVSTSASKPVALAGKSWTGAPASLPGDLASAGSANFFSFQAPAALAAPAGLDLTVQTAGLSLLAPRIVVTDPYGQVVASASAPGPLQGGASVHLAAFSPGQTYKVQVSGAPGDAFAVGSYELTAAATRTVFSWSDPVSGSEPLPEPKAYTGATPLVAAASISGPGQVEVYSFKAPATTSNGLTLSFQDWGVGLAAPSVAVFDARGNPVGSATAADASTTSLNVHVPYVAPLATYYVRVATGTLNPIDFGTYQATVSFAPATSSPGRFVLAIPWVGNGNGNGTAPAGPATNTTFQAAAALQTPAGDAPGSHYEAIDGLDPSQPFQFYSLAAPKAPKVPKGQAPQAQVMTVSVQALGSDALAPWVAAFDSQGNPLSSQVLTEQGGVAVIQVVLPTSGGSYVLEVSAAPVAGSSDSGNYVLNATFGTTQAGLGLISSGAASASPTSTSLAIGQGELYQFVLAGSAANTAPGALLSMTLLDASGAVVATLTTPAALAESLVVCLPPGNYTILIAAEGPAGQPILPLAYTLGGTNLTDPTKVYTSSGSGGATTGS